LAQNSVIKKKCCKNTHNTGQTTISTAEATALKACCPLRFPAITRQDPSYRPTMKYDFATLWLNWFAPRRTPEDWQPMREDTALCWLRRDLRLYDNAALDRALRAHARVVCVFVFDQGILAPLTRADRRVGSHHRRLQGVPVIVTERSGPTDSRPPGRWACSDRGWPGWRTSRRLRSRG